MCSVRALSGSTILWFASLAPSQSFAEPAYAHLPRVDRDVGRVAISDWDADGDADVLVTDRSGTPGVRLWRNDGHARLREENLAWSSDPGPATAVAVGDIDGDGQLDLVLGTRSPSYRVLVGWNGGPPGLGLTLAPIAGLEISVRDLDLVVAGRDAGSVVPDVSLAVVENLGGRSFAVRVVLGTSEAVELPDLAHGDVDGDGDMDLLLAGSRFGTYFAAFLLVNDGRGGFTDVSAVRLPSHLHGSTSVELSDFDGDGDLDAVVGGEVCALLVNDGAGTFVDETGTRAAALAGLRPSAVRAADVDADGDIDLVGTGAERGILMRNEGGGRFRYERFALPSAGTELSPGPHDVALVDLDGSGVRDLLFVRAPRCRLLLDRRDLTYVDAGRNSVPIPVGVGVRQSYVGHQVRVVDLDGDGAPEVLLARAGLAVCSNDGHGGFGVTTQWVARPRPCTDIEVADFDRDGRPDVFAVEIRSALLRNLGGGRFAVTDFLDYAGTDVSVADFDGDGWPDLYGLSSPGRIWRNDRSGGFVEVTGNGVHPGYPAFASCVADFDGDGDPDVLIAAFATRGEELVFARNDGAAGFVTAPAAAARLPVSLAQFRPADFDGDGDIDFVAVGYATNGPYLGINDGNGFFTIRLAHPGPAGALGTIAVIPVDLDGDGDIDLAVTRSLGSVRLLENDGRAGFVERPDLVPFVPYGYGHSDGDAGDVDGDGDIDLVIADAVRSTVLLQEQRGLDAPFLPEPGRTWALDVLRGDGAAGPPRFVMVAVGSGRARVEVPSIGVWRLDPARAALLPPIYVPGGTGTVQFTLDVPNDPALSWGEVFTQAVEVEVGGAVRFTNARLDRVR